MRANRGLNRKAQFESLEDRAMLSLTTLQAGTTLEVFGTAASESVQAYQSGGVWKLQGLGGTKVNGSLKAQSFPGITDLTFALGAGNDFVQVLNGTLSGNLEVVYEPSDTGIKTTSLANLKVGSLQVVNLSTGINVIAAGNVQTTAGDADFSTGDANDVISLAKLQVAGNLQITAGNGNNVIAVANIQTAGGSSSDVIETGNGIDSISVAAYTSSNNLDIMSGDGQDAVAITKANLGSGILFVDVGGGNKDVLVVNNSTAGLGDFNDTDGTNGYISGVGNHFATTIIDPNFTNRAGNFKA